jgi:hypothetical protein
MPECFGIAKLTFANEETAERIINEKKIKLNHYVMKTEAYNPKKRAFNQCYKCYGFDHVQHTVMA